MNGKNLVSPDPQFPLVSFGPPPAEPQRTNGAIAMGQTSPLPQGFNTGGRDLEQLGAEEILKIGFDLWGRDLLLCTSLQSEGMVLLDMSLRLFPNLRVFTIDTGRLPEETHEFIAEVRRHYGIQFEVYHPDAEEVSRLVTLRGANAFRETPMDRQACCHI